jgi:drug/metabolite transporter (DMT)-like permease
MRAGDVGRLVALAAIWGASFLFMRIAAPVLGPVLTADLRMVIAGAALAAYFHAVGFDAEWRRWGRQYAVVGTMNSGVPFVLYSYAALHIPAGLSAILNATSPMWGALLAALWLGERLTPGRAAGLALGVAGVALVSQPESGASLALPAIAAALAAAFCYGLTGAYIKRFVPHAPSRGMAVGTQVAAGAMLLPFVALAPPPAAPTALAAGAVLALGLLSGAIAYLLYFRLLADLGPTRALTVTYLIPVFGVLWGVLFLDETVTAPMLAGAALVILGTVLVLRH